MEGIKSEDIIKKLNEMHEHIRIMNDNVVNLSIHQITANSNLAKWMDDRRKEDAERDKKLQYGLTFYSVLLGMTSGILGNIFASLYLKYFEATLTLIDWVTLIIIIFALLSMGAILIWSSRRYMKGNKL